MANHSVNYIFPPVIKFISPPSANMSVVAFPDFLHFAFLRHRSLLWHLRLWLILSREFPLWETHWFCKSLFNFSRTINSAINYDRKIVMKYEAKFCFRGRG